MNQIEAATATLVKAGAVLHTWNSPKRTYLIGDISWLGYRRLFWFPAHGDRLDDGRVLDFDCFARDGDAIDFYKDGTRIARVTDVANADVDDREDYAVAFSLWQHVQPRLKPLIDRARSAYETSQLVDTRAPFGE